MIPYRPPSEGTSLAVRQSMTRELSKVLRAHAETVAVCEACATTTRELAAEVMRGGLPKREDLQRTVDEAERVLADLARTRQEVERLLTELG